jgi:hypothetical protein
LKFRLPWKAMERLRAALEQHSIRLIVLQGNQTVVMAFDKRLIEGQPVGAIVQLKKGTLTRITDTGWVQWRFTEKAGSRWTLREIHRRFRGRQVRRASRLSGRPP